MYNDCYIRPPKKSRFHDTTEHRSCVQKNDRTKVLFKFSTMKCPASSKLLLALSSIENPLYENVASFQESGQFQSSFLSEPNFVFIVRPVFVGLKNLTTAEILLTFPLQIEIMISKLCSSTHSFLFLAIF